MLRKILVSLLLVLFISNFAQAPTANAFGILPKPSIACLENKGTEENPNWKEVEEIKQALRDENRFRAYIKEGASSRDDLLGCAIKLGRVKLFMMPFYITYVIEFLLEIAGLIAVLFVVYGGYLYVVGGITEEKEKGKKAILHALMGLIVALSAWLIVNLIQVALTS